MDEKKERTADFIDQLSHAMWEAARGKTLPLPETDDERLEGLADAFSALQEQLAEARQTCEAQREQHRLALARVVHDLRLPLTTIVGYTEALQRHMDTTPEKRESFLAAIALRAQELSQLIDTLSALRKEPDPAPEPGLALAAWMRDWVRTHDEELHRRCITLSLSIDEALRLPMDALSFRRIWLNLLSNTVKYRRKETSAVSLSFTASGTESTLVYHDDGPGIRPENLDQLFAPGFREDPAGAIPGSGLGLHIVEDIVRSHHGRVSAKNEQGLSIYLTFPLTGGSSC